MDIPALPAIAPEQACTNPNITLSTLNPDVVAAPCPNASNSTQEGASSFTWYLGTSSTPNIAGGAVTTTVGATVGDNYYWVVYNNGCFTEQTSFLLTLYSNPNATLSNSGAACAGESITFTAMPAGASSYTFFEDLNSNGMLDGGETLQSGVNNTYSSSSLANGDVISVLITDANTCTDVATSTAVVDICGSIGNYVFFDANGDGIYDTNDGDLPLAGVSVQLYDAGFDTPIGSNQITGADGSYGFSNLPAGTYYVVFTPPAGYTSAAAGSGDNQNNITGANGAGSTNDITYNPISGNDFSVDAGFEGTGSIGDTVYEDTDGSGLQNGAESGIMGVTVTATWFGPDGVSGGGDDVVYTDVTDGTGNYSITGLPPGNYDVEVTSGAPSGSTATQNSGGLSTTLTAGQDYNAADFGYEPAATGTIGDFVFFDADGDGMYEPADGDQPLAGVTVQLYDATTDTQIGSDVVTDAAGNYEFTSIPAGTYYVVFATPSGYTSATAGSGNNQNNITGVNGAGSTNDIVFDPSTGDNLTIDASFTGTGSIGDTVYEDTDGNGMQNGTESGIMGVTVTATWFGQTVCWAAATTYYTDVTDATGSYDITGLPQGNYDVSVTGGSPVGSTATQNGGGLSTTLTAEQDYNAADFGYEPAATGTIGDFVFFDADGDGMYEPADGDQPLAGVTVQLYDAATDTQIGSDVVTNAAGNYEFTSIPAGTYYVVFATPAGYTSATGGSGNNQNNITGANGAGSTNDIVFDPSAGDNLTIDASFTGTGSIGDTVYEDTDGSGLQNGAESGIMGVTVTVTWFGPDGVSGGGDDVVYTDVTDGTGNYSITGLPPGNYDVEVTSGAPSGSTATQNSGGLSTTLTAGQDYNAADFGYEPEMPAIAHLIKGSSLNLGIDGIATVGDVVTYTYMK
ncbi:MAG: SdrD B-like domain-containing protein [Saprospiraceae bacterium]